MATIRIPNAIPPTKIERFLGLNENQDGQYGLKLGEAVKQIGWRVTSGGQLKKMEGYQTIFEGLTGKVQGMWYGKLNNSFFFLFANNGHLWKGDLVNKTKTDLGTLTDAPTRFMPFGDKVYILNGYEYKSYDGTTFEVVEGYRPLVAISTPPAGGGTLYEQINVLTGKKHQTFSPDGNSTRFQLAETMIDSIDFMKVTRTTTDNDKLDTTDSSDDVTSYTADVNYKVDLVKGIIDTAPVDIPMGDSTTQITVTKDRSNIYKYTWTSNGTNPNFSTNLAVKDTVVISVEQLADCNNGIFAVTEVGTNFFKIKNKKGKAQANRLYGTGYIYKRQVYGDSTTVCSITTPATPDIYTVRYTYGSGTNPNFATHFVVGDYVWVNCSGFSSGNNGVFQITAVTTTYIEIVNEDGVAEATKTVTNGGFYKCTCSGQPIGILDTGVPNNVDIGWNKTDSASRALIEKCRFAMDYSGQTDSRLFLWGNTSYKNRRFWSGLADGVPSAEYFEANSYDDLGNGEYAITDIVKQLDRQKIFLENGAMYSYYTTETIGEQVTATFPVYELNDNIGNVAEGQVQVLDDSPYTLFNGVYSWLSTTVRDQTNNILVSQRVQNSLDEVDLSKAITYNWQEMKEYWINIGSTVWIYNYLNDTWYKRNNVSATCFLVINGEMYFGTNGTIEKFGSTLRNDNGSEIETVWEMGFYDFEAEYLKKYMSKFWVALKADTKARIQVNAITNNEGENTEQTLYYSMATFSHCDFNHFSFKTASNPQPFRVRMKEKGFAYLKIRLSSDSLTDVATVLSINIQIRTGGKV